MATDVLSEATPPRSQRSPGRALNSAVPPLQAGDRLTRAEFLRRYDAMPHIHNAELIEGVVYMTSPVSIDHGESQFRFNGILFVYQSQTPGVAGGDNGTVLLDMDNAPQPDAYLRILPECGGQTVVAGEYLEGAPELIAEVAASSKSYDLHDKLNAYRRNGVQEYVVWRVWDQAVDWFVLDDGRFVAQTPGEDGVLRSRVMPGLWLDAAAVLNGDMPRVLEVLNRGIASPEHAEFVKRLGMVAGR